MSKYLRGTKRLAIIQKWLNGHEDDEWEVLPTKKDGRYIVRQRQNMPKRAKTSKQQDLHNDVDNNVDDNDDNDIDHNIQADDDDNEVHNTDADVDDEDDVEPTPEPKPTPPSKPVRRTAVTTSRATTSAKPKKYIPVNTSFDPTINLEILEQLKLLGNELKYEREKKQQKQMIKHQINKQLNNRPTPQQINYQNIEPEPEINTVQQTQMPTQIQPQLIPKRKRLDLRNM